MAKPKILKENEFILRVHQGTTKHPENGEEIDISISGCSPAITYKGRIVIWAIQDLLNEAVELIESEENNV